MAEALERARDPKELQNSSTGRLHAGVLVQTFEAVRLLARNPMPASIVLPLQQILREAHACCIDFARFALAYTSNAGSLEKAEGAYRQLSLSYVQLPVSARIPGILVADSLRVLSLADCAALDMWLTEGLTQALYGMDAADVYKAPFPTQEQVRVLMDVMLRSRELDPGGSVNPNVLLEILHTTAAVHPSEDDGGEDSHPGTHPAFDDAASGGDDNGQDG